MENSASAELKPPEKAKRYEYRVSYSEEDGAYVAHVVEWDSLQAHGDTREEALNELEQVVAFSIEDCVMDDEEYPEPYRLRKFSGTFSVRIPPSLHRELTSEADAEGVSLNQLVTKKLAQ